MQVLTDWLLTPERAAIHLPTAVAVVADLHIGYEQARRRRGEAIPVASLEARLLPLAARLARENIRQLVIAGDLVQEGRGSAEVVAEFMQWLHDCGVELLAVVPGNHDRGLSGDVGPLCPDGLLVGAWRVVHGDGPLPSGPVVHGHFHPCLRIQGTAAPCYLVGADRLILPAFSADAAGVNVLRMPAWLRWSCCAIAGDRVLDFGPVATMKTRMKQGG